MQKERQAILSLVALGRITPIEAERLLAVWNNGREELWVIVGCLTACLTQFDLHSFVQSHTHLARTLLSENIPALHRALSVISLWVGGSL